MAEHDAYLLPRRTHEEVEFLKKYLELSKTDKILDAACGNGRHAIALAREGFLVDGVDSSEYLLNLARKEASFNRLTINFYHYSLENLELDHDYDKIFMMFSDFGIMKATAVIKKLSGYLKNGGLLLLDLDSLFRLKRFLKTHPQSEYYFDDYNQILRSHKDDHLAVQYYSESQLRELLLANDLQVENFCGNYDGTKFSGDSPRMIAIAKKNLYNIKE